ncbi:chemotaxis protein CheD [Zymobacter palmae]|uniref:Probable chemoreceptor glutamine deamidase CheD n=1 Tax=Zymobacter palmae TaxID=33074 RepID=A0A348HFK1_9GAMM|nr:chemotaxis protein CheD [Zymobacter palmae]BBG30403.1 probable chemoreceptor glutamine deamidase cheD [Zymobacter palmae]
MVVGEYRKASTSFFDNRYERHVIKLLPGEYYIALEQELLATVLGSCVSLCLFDPVLKIGGMNHFMLPDHPKDNEPIFTRYGWPAMTCVLEGLLNAGAIKSRLVAKVFGGAQGFRASSTLRVGEMNIASANRFLAEQGLNCQAKDVGGRDARRLLFFSDSGQVKMLRMVHTQRQSDEGR